MYYDDMAMLRVGGGSLKRSLVRSITCIVWSTEEGGGGEGTREEAVPKCHTESAGE